MNCPHSGDSDWRWRYARSMRRAEGNTYRAIAEVLFGARAYSRTGLEDPRPAQPHHPSCANRICPDARRLSRAAAPSASQEIDDDFGGGTENPPPHHRHPPSPVHSAIVTPDAPRTSRALHEIDGAFQMPDPNAGLPPRYLRTPEAARFLSLSGRTLEKHRTYGTGPAYRKLGGRVVYALEDLKAWADRGAKTSTSDPGTGTVLPAKRHAAGCAPMPAKSRR